MWVFIEILYIYIHDNTYNTYMKLYVVPTANQCMAYLYILKSKIVRKSSLLIPFMLLDVCQMI